MQQIPIPAKDLVHCAYCDDALNATAGGVYHRGSAWFKQQKRARSGTNSACLVEWANDWACQYCIGKILDGVPVNQLALFIVPYPDD